MTLFSNDVEVHSGNFQNAGSFEISNLTSGTEYNLLVNGVSSDQTISLFSGPKATSNQFYVIILQ